MTTARAVIVVVALAAASCGTKTPCGAGVCDGCCDETGVCLTGRATAACGVQGMQCAACAAGEVCLGGACFVTTGCSSREDCPTLQCRCGDAAHVPTRECSAGRCRHPTELCDDACVAAGHPKPGASDGGTGGYSFCVDGTEPLCTGTELDWSGARCCVGPGYGQCVGGTAAACAGADLEWTGATCCVKTPYGQCVAGSAAACSGDLMEWTGLQCCVRDTYYLCADGTETACGGGLDFVWTGAKCCALAAFTQCVDGTALSCQSPNMRWTGSRCCVRGAAACADGTQSTCTGEWTGAKCCE